MKSKKIIPEAFKCRFVMVAILLVAFQYSCVSSGQMAVAPERRIPLFESTPYEGSWESSDVVLEYQYVKQTDVIQLSVTGKAKRGYDQLNIWVLFVDADGKVLEKGTIYNSGFRSGTSKQRRHKGKIEKTFEMPLETTHIAFQSSWQPRLGR
ncbi:MAG: hypothetical protein PVG87_09985 [Desulfobacteraceae bacterium]